MAENFGSLLKVFSTETVDSLFVNSPETQSEVSIYYQIVKMTC